MSLAWPWNPLPHIQCHTDGSRKSDRLPFIYYHGNWISSSSSSSKAYPSPLAIESPNNQTKNLEKLEHLQRNKVINNKEVPSANTFNFYCELSFDELDLSFKRHHKQPYTTLDFRGRWVGERRGKAQKKATCESSCSGSKKVSTGYKPMPVSCRYSPSSSKLERIGMPFNPHLSPHSPVQQGSPDVAGSH